MAPTKHIISKEATTSTMDKPFTNPETMEIIRKPENALCQRVNMVAYKIQLFTVCGIKKHE
jgi:hypothetical protein